MLSERQDYERREMVREKLRARLGKPKPVPVEMSRQVAQRFLSPQREAGREVMGGISDNLTAGVRTAQEVIRKTLNSPARVPMGFEILDR